MSISVPYVYDTLQTLIRKDQKGNSFNISEFNRVAKLINYELYGEYSKKVGKSTEVNEAIKNLLKMGATISLTTGGGDLPDDYERIVGKPYTIAGSIFTPVDVVISLELPDRSSDELTKPTVEHPICIIGGYVATKSRIQVYPNTIASLSINYLRLPSTPILDYYINANGTYTYLDVGATDITIPVGAVYSDGVTTNPATVNSLTIDFEWHEDQTPIIINMILQKAGIILDDQVAIQYGIAKQTKEEQDD
jgi:hypothetical protein